MAIFAVKTVVLYVDRDKEFRYKVRNFLGSFFEVQLFDDLLEAKRKFAELKAASRRVLVVCEEQIHPHDYCDGCAWARQLLTAHEWAVVLSKGRQEYLPWVQKNNDLNPLLKVLRSFERQLAPTA